MQRDLHRGLSGLDAARRRARIISRRVRDRADEAVRQRILSCDQPCWKDRQDLAIDEAAWRCVKDADIDPRLVFAHPAILQEQPCSSLHYRGIALLSLKRVSQLVGSVKRWEEEPEQVQVEPARALEIARLFNSVISTIILDATVWTLQDAYRNILANIGISADGSMRNRIGRDAEKDVRERIVSWLKATPSMYAREVQKDRVWMLGEPGTVRMEFGSEPDIAFRLSGSGDDEFLSTIEIKGGRDPAGAMERLGAVKKSFDRTPARTKNFLVAGVVTSAMQRELDQMRVERVFVLDDTLQIEEVWIEFVNEISHHTLRLLDAPWRPT